MVDGGSILPELPGCGDTSHGEQREVPPCIVSSCSEDDCGQQQPGLSGVCWYQGPLGPLTTDRTVQSYGEPSH